MADFLTAYKLTVDAEGLYSNDEADTGGETILGLTRVADADWEGWKLVDKYKAKDGFPKNLKEVRSELDGMAQSYYEKKYWGAVWGDKIIDQEVANRIFDTYVNTGSMGITLAQRALDLFETGKMNEITLKKLNNQA